MAVFSSAPMLARPLLSAFFLMVLAAQTARASISYCSSQNTGTYGPFYAQYQSNGACTDTCRGLYGIAVVSGYNCWCSNAVPGVTTSLSECNTPCPGYGFEYCGNASRGLYAYILIDGISPSSTAPAPGASSASASSSSPSSVSTIPSSSGLLSSTSSSSFGDISSLTVYPTSQSSRATPSTVVSMTTVTEVTSVSVASSTPLSVSSPSSAATSSAPTTSSSSSATQVYTSVTTVTGQVRTIVVTPTSPSDSTLGSSSQSNSGGGGVSPGKVVGIVVGVALGLGILIGLGVWMWLRRRHSRNTQAASITGGSATGGNGGVPSRQVSQMSSAGLLGKVPRIMTAGLSSGSGPKSADSTNVDRRSLGTDQRLNPYAIYAHEESRMSNVSLQDNQDYSRQLRVANPDP